MKVGDYFSGIEKSLLRIRGAEISGQITSLASDDYNGLLRCRVLFWDDSFLDIYEVVNTELGYPVKVHYSYIYLAVGNRIFRYDNAPHHPEVSTHPHHKHIGERDKLTSSSGPSLSQILDEIEDYLKEK